MKNSPRIKKSKPKVESERLRKNPGWGRLLKAIKAIKAVDAIGDVERPDTEAPGVSKIETAKATEMTVPVTRFTAGRQYFVKHSGAGLPEDDDYDSSLEGGAWLIRPITDDELRQARRASGPTWLSHRPWLVSFTGLDGDRTHQDRLMVLGDNCFKLPISI